MKVVAYTELFILARVVIGAVTLQNSLLAPVIYAHFLRMRYYQSRFTQQSVVHVNLLVDGFLRKPGNPPILLSVWEKVQMVLGRWAGTVLQPTPEGGGAR